MTGTLFVVATPIGNLEDLTPRALRVLRSVSRVACEDTRRTSRLLARHGIETKMISCHRFNEHERLEAVLKILEDGGDVALVSDGGTPAVSDPGAALVRFAAERGVRVVPIPGPSAVAAILSASGLPSDRFVFDGFLPHRAGERRRRLRDLCGEPRTIVLFESPRRIRQTLEDLADIFGSRTMVLGRELTKRFETILRGSAEEISKALGDLDVKGEISLAVAGAVASAPGEGELAARLVETWREALRISRGDTRKALRDTARALGLGRSELWRLLTERGEVDRGPR